MRAIATLLGILVSLAIIIIVVSLAAGGDDSAAAGSAGSRGTTEAGSTSPSDPATTLERVDPFDVYDPVAGGEPVPQGYRQLLRRDQIAPIYDPTFVPAPESSWKDDALVIGLEIDGSSKAYPVGFLNRREMVIDRLSGVPVLVTW